MSYPFEIFPWNDDPNDKTGWVDADQAKAAFEALKTAHSQEIEELKRQLEIERAEVVRWRTAIHQGRR